ncbi:chitobiase/beta-hexosaminidase C-terminal domain-containing protein [Rhabdobacter roseus]|uniref:Putative membrane protein n=1 Tax=Rhabdobacter roseus TaxID=1655419 RepID=A0A840TR98_9BACT|nr:chitobiase/beta-hexosaminidase C-terminal domain-containing protein [Rhabdobacter roseus]MBB5284072.1 putative membrane protein [Rhabdobacter roseus]
MPRFRSFVYNSTFFLNGLLLFLLVMESRLVIPAWLQVAGRMHPLLLHFPIVVLVLYAGWILVGPRQDQEPFYRQLADQLLLLGAFTAALTALVGLLLAQEEGYEASALFWHKWTGAGTSFLSLTAYHFRNHFRSQRVPARLASAGLVGLLLYTGHLGGNITHGADFVLAPLRSGSEPSVALADAVVFTHLVQPVLEEKCISCHSTQKAKGELVMETAELLTQGGKNGVLWDTTQADLGLLLRRVHLPLDDKKHMPPKGKVQLTEAEVLMLESWIRRGASFTMKVHELPTTDPLYAYAAARLQGTSGTSYDFPVADESTLRELTSNYRVITPLFAGSPALVVNFYNPAGFSAQDITALKPIREQVVAMDLSTMPLKDEDVKSLAQFPNLERLILNFTPITGSTLTELKKVPRLKTLSLTGTKVTAAQLRPLSTFPALRTVYAADTDIPPTEFDQLKKQLTSLHWESGFRSDTVRLKLTPPVIENEEQIISGPVPLRLKHAIRGTVIRYTTDGSEPDSVSSPVYKPGITIAKNTQLKARVFKEGWYGSDQAEYFFFQSALRPQRLQLITKPDPQYPAQGSATLMDSVKSEASYKSGQWLGYLNEPMVLGLHFEKPTAVSSITLSTLRQVSNSIFPPEQIEVWGGPNEKQLKVLGTLQPTMPTLETRSVRGLAFECKFDPTTVQYIKVVAKPVGKLPPWHSRRGERAWVFVDELFVN